MEQQRVNRVPHEHRCDTVVTLLHAIVSGETLTHADAIAAFRTLYAREPSADGRLLQFMKDGPVKETPRILNILAHVSDGKRLVQGLLQYISDPDPRVRAEAALLVARGRRDLRWVLCMLKDPDPRVRANVVEGFSAWNRDPGFLSLPLQDVNHRVVCNAIVAMFGLDPARARVLLDEVLLHHDWRFRAAGTWAIGASGCQDLYAAAERMQADVHASVRFNALRAMSVLRRSADNPASPAVRRLGD
jgi:hypothetical protein